MGKSDLRLRFPRPVQAICAALLQTLPAFPDIPRTIMRPGHLEPVLAHLGLDVRHMREYPERGRHLAAGEFDVEHPLAGIEVLGMADYRSARFVGADMGPVRETERLTDGECLGEREHAVVEAVLDEVADLLAAELGLHFENSLAPVGVIHVVREKYVVAGGETRHDPLGRSEERRVGKEE